MQAKYRSLGVVALAMMLLSLALPSYAGVLKSGSKAGSSKTNAFAPSTPSPILYYQNPDFNGAYSSQNDTIQYGNFATAFDNFTLGTTSNIDEVAWIGSYFNPPSQGAIYGFTLTFYADAGGAPGAALWQGYGAGTLGETYLGDDNAGDPAFIYDATLGTPFVATAGVQYWMSLVPDLDFPPQWGWETSLDGDGQSYQCFLGTCGALPSDLSFALYGTQQSSVPEPSSLLLLGTGALGLAGAIRRKLF